MIKSSLLTAGALAALVLSPLTTPHDAETARAHADGQKFVVDALHSSVIFRVQHLAAAQFYGRFNKVEGEFLVDDEDLEKSYLRVSIPVASIDSNDEKRDEHLRSSDFFSAKEHPTITLESKKVTKTGDDTYHVVADLTLRGEKNEIELDVTHTGTASLVPNFGLRTGYEAVFEIDRTAFGMSYYAKQGVLGKTVRLTVSIEGKLPK